MQGRKEGLRKRQAKGGSWELVEGDIKEEVKRSRGREDVVKSEEGRWKGREGCENVLKTRKKRIGEGK